MDTKDRIINKLALKIGQLEYDKANIQTQLELANKEILELRSQNTELKEIANKAIELAQ